jgi:hypothetical protein
MFEDDSIKQELRTIKNWVETIKVPSPQHPAPEVAVIYDEHSIAYLKGGLKRLHWTWWRKQSEQLNLSGVPYMIYYADDLRAGNIPDAKVYLFVNQINLDPKMIKAIENLKLGGKTLVFKQDVGFVQYSQGRIDDVTKVIGMNVKQFKKMEHFHSEVSINSGHTILKSLNSIPRQDIAINKQSVELPEDGLFVNDSKADILSVYEDTGLASFAVRDHGDWKSVFVGTYGLSAEFFHAITQYADAWCLAPCGYPVACNGDVLMIHPLKSGPAKITLKKPAKLKSIDSQQADKEIKLEHVLNLEAGDTYLYNLN